MRLFFNLRFLFLLLLCASCTKQPIKIIKNGIEVTGDVILQETTEKMENKESAVPIYRELSRYEAYEFNPGYYYMLDYPVRIRKEPNLESETIGMLGKNSRIKIISSANLDIALEIDNISALWYQIEYENITGYIWGGYISAGTLIYDIDNNGIDDYFYYRVSAIQGPHFYYVNAMNDVIIYLNNEKISTEDIYVINSIGEKKRIWGTASFKVTENNTVLIIMFFGDEDGYVRDTFEMDSTGKIVLIEQYSKEYEKEE
jgi:hypothetical protein